MSDGHYHEGREAAPKQLLSVYAVKPSEDFPGWLLVTCPKEDCGEKSFLVHKESWLVNRVVSAPHSLAAKGIETVEIEGRSCPYCMRVSRPPRGGRRK